ncbi:nucleotide-binding universal stress UspA family protein [Bradyrhizobium japonicum]
MSDQARSTVGQRQIGRAGQKRANLDLDRPGKQVPRAGTNDIGQWIINRGRLTESKNIGSLGHGVSLSSRGSGRLVTRLDTPPSSHRHHPDSAIAQFLVEQARAADLIVVKRKQLRTNIPRYLDSAGAMLRMGRPTLSVPDGVTELAGDRIVIGWKDTREARLAVREALPFLTRASRVTIAEICTSDEQDAAHGRVRDVANYLRKHGVSCEHEVRVHTAEPDAGYLIRLASDVGADLIVTGGYGHSRLGEWMFGGMTQRLLQQAQACLLMAH